MKMLISTTALLSTLVIITQPVANAAICTENTPEDSCELIRQDIAKRYEPGPHNNFGRYRSFLALEAIKIRRQGGQAYNYMDYSSEAYGEGQVWLSLPPDLKKEALTIPPGQIRSWLLEKASPERLALIRAEVKTFSGLNDHYKMLWMTMRPENRLKATEIERDSTRRIFIVEHRDEISFDPYTIESPQYLLDSWKLFND